MENLIVAVSNYPVIYLFQTTCIHQDIYTAILVSFVGYMSFLSHLYENHKYGMPGLSLKWLSSRPTRKISYFLNRCDVIGVIMLCVRLLYLYFNKYGLCFDPLFKTINSSHDIQFIILNSSYDLQFIIGGLLCLILNIISNIDKYNPRLKYFYILTHSLWHYSIFTLTNIFYQDILM